MQTIKPNIVIIGGGAGGLELATQLGHKLGRKNKANIILIDKNRTHIWKPLLHEVATGSLDTSLDGVVYSAHAAKHGFSFQLGEFYSLNKLDKTIKLKMIHENMSHSFAERTIQYSTLVIAIGSVSNDFNTPGVKEQCYFLDSHKQAERFQHALLNHFTQIHQNSKLPELKIAIVGAGATGVELSAELYHVAALLKSYGLNNMTADKLKVYLIEAGPKILPALPERITHSAKKELMKLGVEVHENTKIASANEAGLLTSEGTLIKADLRVWAAGVKVADFIKELDIFELNRANQIIVTDMLKSSVDDSIYVLGDACAFKQGDGSFVPPRAQAAHQMAKNVAHNILNEIDQKPLIKFDYTDHGSLVNLSRFSTVGSLMGNLTQNSMFVEGKIARIMYMSLYRMHQRAIHGSMKTFALWLVEKLMKVVRPRMKLH
ncbi:NAD(P)/FAD-dependent oxidoreductase [Pseudoalteromonas denitrificans]|uniref:NADH dehydrogenase n=1 Tax=Pseudoalteromonas denitrificans DSM 6059 TaxID=1123010 RepID=A0A1I1KUA0_9GAMM|nr:NAD(P)/FAD-dependent oxidoreductase [Pseudoalteromonas denitrificans]SFC64359.1 NADH dehydrogenase [Pseudoalteromonas denitrificans DSM 6059]